MAGGWLSLENIRYKGNDYLITKDLKPVLKSEKMLSDEPLMLRVTPDKTWSINYDDDLRVRDNKNEDRKKCAEIIPYHHQMQNIEGLTYYNDSNKPQLVNPNAGGALLFEFEDMAFNHVSSVKIVKMMGAAYNKINDMSYEEKVDLMYYYGEKPVTQDGLNMKHSEVFMRLVGDGFGVVYRRTIFADTKKTYLDHFLNDYDVSNDSHKLKVAVLKAEFINDSDSKPLVKREGSAWMYGQDIIGSNVEEAVAWFNNHPKLKEYVLNTVAKKDYTNDDDMDEVLTKYDKPSEASLVLKMKVEYEAMKDYAKKLRIPLPGVPTIQSLKEKIALAEPIWAKVKELDLESEIDADPKMRIEKVEQVVKEREKELRKQLKTA